MNGYYTPPFGSCPETGMLYVANGHIVGLVPATTGDFARFTGTTMALSSGAQDNQTNNNVIAAIVNTTASVVSPGPTQQYSGLLKLGGTAWKSNATAASQTQDYAFQVRTTTGAASTTGALHVLYSDNGGAWSNNFRFDQTAFYVGSGTATYLTTTSACVGTNLILYGSVATGIGIDAAQVKNTGNQPLMLYCSARTDGANKVCVGAYTSSTTGIFANMATMAGLSVGVGKTNTTAGYFHRVDLNLDGSIKQMPELLDASGVVIANTGGYSMAVAKEIVTLAAGATTESTITIPAGAVLYGLSLLVRTGTTTAVNVDVGITGTTTLFAENLSLVAGTKLELALVPVLYGTATKILFTPDATPGDANGRLILQLHYHTCTAASA